MKLPSLIMVLLVFIPLPAIANELVRISATIEFSDAWMEHALPDQRTYITRLSGQTRPVKFDVAPHHRFTELLDSGQSDCVLTALPERFANKVVSNSTIRFELRLFHRSGVDLNRLSKINIGFLVNLPRPPVPLAADLVWYDLRTIEQGVDLLLAGRLDAVIGDRTQVMKSDGALGAVQSALPPVKIVRLALVCRNTDELRDFVSSFDDAMGVSDSGVGSDQFGLGDTRYLVWNGW